VLADPVEDPGEAKFVAVHRAVDELVPFPCIDFDLQTVASQEDIGSSEGNPLVAVEKAAADAIPEWSTANIFY
jgi:hypothetical protein